MIPDQTGLISREIRFRQTSRINVQVEPGEGSEASVASSLWEFELIHVHDEH